ncbi:MAG: response regulator [Deltaproteobacteria bacterium]|nr:response regulator [Deltaproteobacteria bacterium]
MNTINNPKILIVDDEPDILELLSNFLTYEGYQITTESRGQEAIDLFRSEPFDLVITDIRMPGMDGVEVLKEIKQLDEDVEVIILTGFASVDSAVRTLRQDGAFDYLTKPLEDIDALIYTIDRALEKRRLRLDNNKKTEELAKANEELRIEIGERKRAEDAFRKSEEKYRILVENASDAIFIIQDEMIKFPNPKANAMVGYSSEELAEIPFIDLIHPDDRDMVLDVLKRVFRGDEVPGAYSLRMINKAGEELWVQLNVVFLSWEGQPAGLSILRDITQQKGMEGQLLQAQKMEAIGALAGGIAHDFNNLLMGIQGNTSLILMDIDSSSPHYEELEKIEQYVQDGADLSKQLLGFARKGKYEVKLINLNEVIEQNCTMFGRTKKEVTIHRKFQQDIWAVKGDMGQIGQVLMNLYLNAWDAMPRGGNLYLMTENVILDEDVGGRHQLASGNYVKLSVTDTGVGIDEETKKRIFEPFFTTKEMGRGTGLGLASVYGIIKNHNGIINVYSETNKGTTFNIYLPASEKHAAKKARSPKEILKGSETILLVDDEDMILDAGNQMLEIMGYNVLIGGSGKEAIETYKKNQRQIHMVILDMIMPDMGGGAVYDEMKKMNPDVKVLLSSGYSIEGEATEILARGCNGFIQKPFRIIKLSHEIRKILDNNA